MNNMIEEEFQTKAERDRRWEELMLIKPHVVRDTTSNDSGKIIWRVRYPMLVR